MKGKRISRMLAILLVFIMVFTLIPGTALAEGEGATCKVTVNFDISSLGTDETLETLSFEKIPSATVTVDRGVTLADALKKAVTKSNGALTITGLDSDSGYITKINQVEGYNVSAGNVFTSMLNQFGIENVPEIFQYAGWMYSGNGLSGYGTKVDTIEQDTTVNFRYTLYYGAASSTEWRNFDWDFIDAYNLLAEKINAAQAIADGGYSGFSDEQKSILNEKLAAAKTAKQRIDDEAAGIWAHYIAEKGTTLWGPDSPTDNLKNAYDELSDAINKVPTPTDITCTGLRNGSEKMDFASTATVYIGDTIKLSTVVLPEGSKQDVVYDTLVGDNAISITEDGVITCQAEADLVMIQVKSERVPSIRQTIMLKIVPAPTYTATFTGIDGLELTGDSVSVRQGQTVYTGTFSEGKVSFGGLKKGEYDYNVAAGDFGESGKLIVDDGNVEVNISGKNTKSEVDTMLNNIASIYSSAADASTLAGPEWVAMDMASYKEYTSSTKDVTDFVKTQITDTAIRTLGASAVSHSNLGKYIIVLQSMGVDAGDIYKLENAKYQKVDSLNNLRSTDVSNADIWSAPWILLANIQRENILSANQVETLVNILDAGKGNGDFGYKWGETYYSSPDTAGTALASLAPIFLSETDEYSVKDKVTEMVDCIVSALSDIQDCNGSFGNANSDAMVIIGLSALGINPDADSRFIKNGNSVVDALLKSANADKNGFTYLGSANALATEQGFRSLVSAAKMIGGANNYNVYDFSSITDLKSAKDEGTSTTSKPEEPVSPNTIKVTISIQTDTTTWLSSKQCEVPADATAFYVFDKAVKEAGMSYVISKGYISSISKGYTALGEFDKGPNSGWLYKVNGKLPNVGMPYYKVNNGDTILMYYTTDWTKDPDASKYPGAPTDQSSVTTSGTSGSATTTTPTEVKVSGDTAKATIKTENATEAIKQAKEKKSAEIVIEVANADIKTAEKVQVELPTATAKEILNTTTADLTVKTPIGTVTVPQDAMKEAVAEAKGTTITVEVAAVSKPTDIQKKAAGTNGQIISVTIKSGSTVISTFGGKSLKLKSEVPAKLKGKNIVAIHIAADGTIEQLTGKLIKEGTKEFYEFITAHLSTFALVDADELGLEANDEEANIEKVKKLVSDMSLKASSSKTSKKNIKVTLTVNKDTSAAIKEIKDMGYTVKYKYYRSTRKASKYASKLTSKKISYTNTAGKKGTKYYYKARVQVYDKDGKLVTQTALKQCRYAARTWTK